MHFIKPPLGTPLDFGNPLNDGIVMHLGFQEGHGDKVQDLSMNGNHGTLNNFAYPPTVASGWNPGQTGIGLNFDGSSDYINCGSAASLRPTDYMMVSTLFKTDHNYIDNGTIINDYNRTAVNGWGIQISNANKLFVFNTQSSGNSRYITSANTVNDGIWHNVVAVFIGGTDITVYIDGENQGASTLGGVVTTINHGSSFRVGAQSNPEERYTKGQIDQVRVLNSAWTAKEVKDYAINPWQVYLDV